MCCSTLFALCTVASVVQAFQNLVVPVGTPFSVYLSELRLLVRNVRSIGHVAPDDGTMQIAFEKGVDISLQD